MNGTRWIPLIFLITLLWHYSRWSPPAQEETPAVVRLDPHLSTIALRGEGGAGGLHQFADGTPPESVTKMTAEIAGIDVVEKMLLAQPAIDGESFEISSLDGGKATVRRSWMPATQRLLLQIPLHPDRMTVADWEALPGVGPKLAQSIETDRQKNGDFVTFEALDRVKGIGPKKLEEWRGYFADKKQRK